VRGEAGRRLGHRPVRHSSEGVSNGVGVRIADIPDSLLAEIDSSLQNYFLPIIGRDDGRCAEPLTLIGSGTLVRIDSSYHILTAAHVWDATKLFPAISLPLGSRRSWLSIPCNYIAARELRGAGSEDSGPDLALLAIPAPFVSQIRAHKSALDLSQQRSKFLADPSHRDSALWAVTGMVEGFSSFQEHLAEGSIEAQVHARSFFGGIDGTHERDGYDYLDAGVDMGLAGVPTSFGGLSGGPLWQIVLSMNRTRQIFWNGKKYVQGVAFWQSAIQEKRRVIRCHGPKSVFEKAWQEWGLPN